LIEKAKAWSVAFEPIRLPGVGGPKKKSLRELNMKPPIHVIVEYNPSPEFNEEAPYTIPRHNEVIAQHGSVLWPKITKSGRTRLYSQDIPRINEQIGWKSIETHFYMYGPEHKHYDRQLHVALLKHIYLEHEIDRHDPRIPPMYHLSEGVEKAMYFFELAIEIKKVHLDELENLLVYPDMTFLDLVSFISPQRVLEAKDRPFFG